MPATDIFAGMARSYAIEMSVVINENWNNPSWKRQSH